MAKHELTIDPDQFCSVVAERKKAEYRRLDKPYSVGDQVVFKEWDPERQKYTGKTCTVKITDIQHGDEHGIPQGYGVLSLQFMSFKTYTDYA